MQIDFFRDACSEETKVERFGICDDTPPPSTPAYLDYNNEPSWIAEVLNPEKKEVKFIAVDNCIDIRRPNGDLESRCDGILLSQETILFIELKDRASKGWVSDGVGQLTITIKNFEANHSLAGFTKREGCVANKQKPFFNNTTAAISQKFKDDTGFILNVKRVIEV